MTEFCPNCGAERLANAPRGLCPTCLLKAGLDSEALSLARSQVGATVDLSARASVLETLAVSLGPVPRVLLADTDVVNGPGPVVKPSSPEMPAPADRSARLQLLGEIAHGGMGVVLKGRDVDIGRDLAVKVLLDDHRDNSDLVRRFIEEAQIAGQLQHPGVVPVYELGTFADRRPYFVMKLVKGRTLATLLDARNDPAEDLPRFLSIFESVCQTVAYAHARGVIHRDLKPSNVMVGSFGEVQVMDWGLAKVLSQGGVADEQTPVAEADASVIQTARADSDASRAGSVLGTPAYMSPEQARGDINHVDRRSDVFGLGSILCEILTGEPAFTSRDTGAILRKAARAELTGAFARLQSCGVDPELVALARDSLAAGRDDRPRDAAVVAERLTSYLTGMQERLRAAQIARAEERARAEEARRTAEAAEARARAERRARRLTAALAASVVALIGIGGGGYAVLQHQRAERRAAASKAINEALEEAAALHGQARSAPVGDVARWTEALAVARRARDLLQQGEADEMLKNRVGTFHSVLEREQADAVERARQAEADRTLLARLETIRIDLGEHLDPKRTDAEYAATFRNLGLDVDRLDPRKLGAALAGRTASIEIAADLDDWAFVRRIARRNEEGWQRLIAAASAVDPNPRRAELWSRFQQGDRAGLERLTVEAIEQTDKPPATLVLLARALGALGSHERAAEVLRVAWRRHPADFWINFELGTPTKWVLILDPLDRPSEEPLRYITAAVAIRPASAAAHHRLGVILASQYRKFDESIAEHREAIRLKPDYVPAYNSLGFSLQELGRRREAIAAWREAVRRDPTYAPAWFWLGRFLLLEGEFAAAADALRQAHQLGASDAARLLERAELYTVLEKRLPAVLKGTETPKGTIERVDFARMCFNLSLYAASARFFAEAYAEDPALTDNVEVGRRYYGAVFAAARAGCGDGKDDPPPDEAERARLRHQALSWFRDELVLWRKQLSTGPEDVRKAVREKLSYSLRGEAALAGVRDSDVLAKLPDEEQKAWRALWADVDTLLKKAQGF
jgi:serine/threonine-protein kinase